MKLDKFKKLVAQQYLQKLAGRDEWCDWLYINHVIWVSKKTAELCTKYGGDPEVAVASALLHDIADSVMHRSESGHEIESISIARRILVESAYDDDEIEIIVGDILPKHSCRDGNIPESLEGKIMATADALAHFETGFYLHAFSHGAVGGDYETMKLWMSKKLDKDFFVKIQFEEIREQIRPAYETLKSLCG